MAPSADSAPAGPRRAGLALLCLALLLALVLGCQGLTDPWENGSRGANGSAFIGTFVRHHVELGLGFTRGGNVTVVKPLDPPKAVFYVHHPPTYGLLLSIPAALFGFSEVVLRSCALLLFLSALPVFWCVARRFVGPLGAGAGALVLAGMPLASYFGPMVNPDGAVLVADLWVALAFLRYVERPGPGRGAVLLLLWILTCLLDWTGYFAGLSLLYFVPFTGATGRALRCVLWLGLASIVPLLLVLGHLTWLVGGVERLGDALRAQAQETRIGMPDAARFLLVVGGHLRQWVTPSLLALGGAGVLAGFLSGRAGRRALGAATALAVPGIASAITFPAHAVMHDYWCLAVAPGLALAAALPVAWAAGELRTGRPVGRLAVLVVILAVTAGTCAFGAVRTLEAVITNRTTLHRDLGALLNTRFGRDDVVCTALSARLSAVYADALLLGPVADMDTVNFVLQTYRRPGRSDRQIGFLLPAYAAGTPLERGLAGLAPREKLGKFMLYCVRG